MIRPLALVAAFFVATAAAPRADQTPPWRARYVDLRLTVDAADKSIAGVARLTLVRNGAAGAPIVLDLSDSLTVDSAYVIQPDRARIAGNREPSRIVFLVTTASTGAYVAAVWYHGRPSRRVVGFATRNDVARGATFGVPRAAQEWWPSIDVPGVKSDSADLWFTAPAALTVASNGRLAARTVNGPSATAHWTVRHPIYADAISFAIADFAVTRSQVKSISGASVSVEYYVFPEDSAKAAATLTNVPRIFPFLERQLGAYPFADEKYALVEMARPSFREGQTLSHLGTPLLTGQANQDQILAHEMAHQWFGNSLTTHDWADIWLHESLAELLAWDWIRESQGQAAYDTLIARARAAPPTPIAPANAADFNTLFGAGTFVKGPLMLTRLRDLIGTATFTPALREFVAAHKYGTVSPKDLQTAFEKVSRKPLQTFFDEWLAGRTPNAQQ